MPTGNWIEITPTTKPSARSYGALAYDGVSDSVILFGGLDSASTRLNDTLAWDGTTWSTLSPTTVPTARDGQVGATVDSTPYMFGGEDSGGLLDDLYKFDGSDWNLEVPPNATYPTERKYAGLADDGNGYPLMWGGDTGSTFDPDVWLYDDTIGWLSSTPATSPEPRMKHAMVYDTSRGAVLMFGGVSLNTGQTLNDLWEWDGSDWLQISTSDAPPARGSTVMAYDSIIQRIVLGSCGVQATGTIFTIDSLYHIDGENFILNDGINTPVAFEFDDDSSVSGGAVAVDITGSVDANVMRDRIITAINGVGGTLHITAYSGGAAQVNLIHDLVDTRGNQTSSTTVANTNFAISNMSGATADTWSLNGGGAQWLEHFPATQVFLLDGAMMTYMDKAGEKVVMICCGTINGVAGNSQYEWVWSTLGVSPYFSLPGTLQGRIQPSAVQATDGQWAMVLGSDQVELPDFMLDIGDEVTVEQQFLLENHKLIRFDWRMRYSPNLPQLQTLAAASSVDFYAPVKSVYPPDLVTLIPGSAPYTDIEFRIPTALFIGDPGVQKFTMVYTPTGVRHEAYGVPSSSPAVVRAGDVMEQTGTPSTAVGDYELCIGDSGLVRTLNNGGDRLIGCSIQGAAPFQLTHEQQLVDISGATDAGNNGSAMRLSSVPNNVQDVGAFGAGASAASIPAGRVAVIENSSAVRSMSTTGVNDSVTVKARGARWRAQCFIDIGSGDVLRAELVENLVQADPSGWQRGHMAAHVSKIAAVATLKFVLRLESVVA